MDQFMTANNYRESDVEKDDALCEALLRISDATQAVGHNLSQAAASMTDRIVVLRRDLRVAQVVCLTGEAAS